MKQIRRHVTYANVMSSFAVFLILGGATAFAAVKKVGPNEIKANSIKTGKIVKEAVKAGKLAKNAVIENKLADGAVTTNKLADNAVTTGKIANDAVSTAKVANNAVTSAKVANGSITSEKLSTQYLPTSTQGVPLAGANVSAAGVVRTWFNRFGGKPLIEKFGAGDYRLTFPGLVGQSYFSTALSTATLIANSGEISLSSANGNPIVNTFTSAGAAADREFALTLIFPGEEP